MPKLRIHELAKELNHSNKEVMDFLKSKQIDVKSHMSSLNENQEALVREEFASKKNQSGKAEEKSVEKPKKKSNIIQVVRPQNATSQEARKKLQKRAQGEKTTKNSDQHKAAEEDTKNQLNMKGQSNTQEHTGSRVNDQASRIVTGTAIARSATETIAIRGIGTTIVPRANGTIIAPRANGTIIILRETGTAIVPRANGTIVIREIETAEMIIVLKAIGTIAIRETGTAIVPRAIGTAAIREIEIIVLSVPMVGDHISRAIETAVHLVVRDMTENSIRLNLWILA